MIDAQAAARPRDAYALSTESTATIDFATLAADSRAVGAWLRALGSRPGEVVAFVMPNGLQTLRLLLGAMHGGWCVCPVNLLSQPAQMRYVLEHSDCTVVFVSPDREATLRAALDGLARPVSVVVTDPESGTVPQPARDGATGAAGAGGASDSAAADRPSAAPDPDAPALLMYTSGTTGNPKGVLLTHANLVANARAISAEHGLVAGDRVLGVLPLYHINAFTVTMLAPLAHGGSVAITPRFSAARYWAQALDTGCTWINVVPTIISYLLEGEDPPPAARTAIRFCRSASAALPPEHLRAFETRFGIGVVETMGLTETAAPSFSNPMQAAARKLGSVGRASGCEACVVDGNAGAELPDPIRPLPDGSVGEILIRGPQVMRGYYKNDAATRASFAPGGWLRTGDLGYRDADGFFFVTGRIKELIIKGGENIAPREIDEVLLRHPAVLEAAVVGVPDRHYGQDIVACIVLREPAAAADTGAGNGPDASHDAVREQLRAFCHEHLGRYKTPRDFHFVAELPRGPSGKVQRLKMLSMLPA
ncbi:MAG: AMP-binding protein [Lautropia sp.]